MKKKLLALLLAGSMLATTGALTLTGCNSDNTSDKPEIPHTHTFNKQVAEEKYLQSEATCTAKAVYYLSCDCGEKGTETFESGNTAAHVFTNRFRYDEQEHWLICDNCNVASTTAAHEAGKNDCDTCGYHATVGLVSTLTASGAGCVITGIGEATDKKIFISSQIDGTPVTEIGEGAFKECENVTQIAIPNTVKSIGSYAFYGCTNLMEFLVYDVDTAKTVNTFSIKPRTYITDLPEEATEIGEGAFANCFNLTEVKIPERITVIGNNAFLLCCELKNLTIPDGVVKIGETAFYGCFKLAELCLSENLESLGAGAFIGCGFESISIHKDNPIYHSNNNCLIETSSKTLIAGCKNSIIPTDGSVTSIGMGAFMLCVGLKNIKIPDTVEVIGMNSFCACVDLETIELRNGLKRVEQHAFMECWNLEAVRFPNGVTYLGKGVFSSDAIMGCGRLKTIYIPKSVQIIDNRDLVGAAHFTIYCESESKPDSWDENWNYGAPIIWDCANNNKDENGYEYVEIDNLKYALKDGAATLISQETAWGCEIKFNFDYFKDQENSTMYELIPIKKELIIPSTVNYNGKDYPVTRVCANALIASGITSITIPNSVTNIEEYAIAICNDLAEITFNGTMVQWQAIVKGEDWNYQSGDFTVQCTDGKLDKNENEIA